MLITNIGKLVTMKPGKGREGELGVIENAEVEIEDGKIKQILPLSNAPTYQRTNVLDARGGVVIPGLIDCHTHLVHAGDRTDEFAMRARGATYEEIAKSGGGIMSTVRATREASEDELFELAKGRACEAMSHGITTLEVKSGYGLDMETELKMLRVVKRLGRELPIEFVPTFLAHMVPKDHPLPNPPPFRGRGGRVCRVEYIRYVTENILPAVAKENLAKFCDVFVENIAFTKDEAEKILKAAEKLGLRSKLHADQISSCGGGALAARLKAISADHLENISKKDMKAMAKARTAAVLIPGSTFFIGGKYAPARLLIKTGVDVAISTDYNPGTSPILNLWLAAMMAITQMKLTPEEAYRGITINAARALGMSGTHGSIEVGKTADIVVLDTKNEFEPFCRFDRNFAERVIKKGEIIWHTRTR